MIFRMPRQRLELVRPSVDFTADWMPAVGEEDRLRLQCRVGVDDMVIDIDRAIDSHWLPITHMTLFEIVLPLPNGGTLRCGPGIDHAWGGTLAICDANGAELLVWEESEWQAEPESVIGAVFSAAVKSLAELRRMRR